MGETRPLLETSARRVAGLRGARSDRMPPRPPFSWNRASLAVSPAPPPLARGSVVCLASRARVTNDGERASRAATTDLRRGLLSHRDHRHAARPQKKRRDRLSCARAAWLPPLGAVRSPCPLSRRSTTHGPFDAPRRRRRRRPRRRRSLALVRSSRRPRSLARPQLGEDGRDVRQQLVLFFYRLPSVTWRHPVGSRCKNV